MLPGVEVVGSCDQAGDQQSLLSMELLMGRVTASDPWSLGSSQI